MKEILDIIHKTIYQFFDTCEDDKEVPMSDKDKFLLEINKAICNNLKALEQQSCKNCISRQEVLDLFAQKCDAVRPYHEVWQAVKELSPVTPQPKIGRWIKTPKAVMGEGYMWYCNKCEHQVYQDSSRPYPSEKYCPNCGAKMEEVG